MKAKLLDKRCTPVKATPGAGCYDLVARKITKSEIQVYIPVVGRHNVNEVKSIDRYEIKLGLEMEIPENFQGILSARSSLSKTGFTIPHGHGEIDSDFRGEIRLVIVGRGKCPYEVGDRCCQFRLVEVPPIDWEFVEELSKTDRGNGGFGHTKK